MSRKQRTVMIEAMENRLMFDGSQLTETITSSTLPATLSDQAVLKGTVSLNVTNNSGIDQKFHGAIGIFIANGALDIPSRNWGILKSGLQDISLANGTSKVYKFAINLARGKLADGVDTMYGVVTDANSVYSQSPAGPTLTVHTPNIVLSETETFTKLPTTATAGTKFVMIDKVAITNTGTDPSTEFLDVDLYATPDGTLASGTLISKVPKKFTINPGKSVTVPITLHGVPALGVGTYDLISAVFRADGTVTTTDPSTAPTFTLTAPFTGSGLDPIITKIDNEIYAPDQYGLTHHMTELDLSMSITNYGALVPSQRYQFTLYAGPESTPDANTVQENSLPLTLKAINHKGTLTFLINFGIPFDGAISSPERDYYFYVQVSDPDGAVSLASWPTQIQFSGMVPITG